MRALKRGIAKRINRQEDSVRIYSLCERCAGGVKIIGTGVDIEQQDKDVLV